MGRCVLLLTPTFRSTLKMNNNEERRYLLPLFVEECYIQHSKSLTSNVNRT